MVLRSLSAALAIALLGGLSASAEEYNEPDAEGCKDSTLLSRLPGCKISECEARDFDESELRTGPANADGEFPMKKLEGARERLVYVCSTRFSKVQIQRNVVNAVKAAGYTVVFTGDIGDPNRGVTAQKGGTWMAVSTQDWNQFPGYELVTVRTQAMAQEMEAGATSWAAEITKSGRVAVYGLEFDTGKATVRPQSEAVLGEMLKLLQQNPTWKLRVEGHTDNVGAKPANQKLSEERAAAVVAWLAGHGVDKARLASQGFGDTKPAGDNTTDAGRAKNRRVELVKM